MRRNRKRAKNVYPEIRLYLISADYHIKPDMKKLRLYDGTFFPSMGDDMKKTGAIHLNKWMVDKADYIIAHIKEQSDWAFQAVEYARKRGKTINNI